MTEAEAIAQEEAWQAKYQQQLADEEEAFQKRGCLPPRHSRVNGPPVDWKRWCALLDGVPVGHCTEFDVDAGWVQVFVVEPLRAGVIRILDTPQRRLYGKVEAIGTKEFGELKKSKGEIVITAADPRGTPIPGTEIRMRNQ
jgi:hypothetical protein